MAVKGNRFKFAAELPRFTLRGLGLSLFALQSRESATRANLYGTCCKTVRHASGLVYLLFFVCMEELNSTLLRLASASTWSRWLAIHFFMFQCLLADVHARVLLQSSAPVMVCFFMLAALFLIMLQSRFTSQFCARRNFAMLGFH